ncbi:MAG TPA: phospholipase D-like domain-containing protein [Anaerolineae bacterium]|nr:phospholipase D-like domain-containing protein [Anaerolineae bacterium]
MTKRRESSSRKQTKKGRGSLTTSVMSLLLVVVILFIGDWLGLIAVDWQGLLSGENLENVVSDKSGTPVAGSAPPVVATPISGEWYQLYFTTPVYPDEPAARTETIMQGLIGVINKAQRSLDIAIYELNLDEIGDALLAARQRGIAVRLVTDSDSLEEDETLIRLEKAGLPIIPDERSPIMHNKFVVVDGQAVWTGSWNFTVNDTYRNNNHGIYIQSPQLAQNYAAEFEEMFSQEAFGPTSLSQTPNPRLQLGNTLIETCFAPEDGCANQLIGLIRQAQQNIRFMAFSFTHAGIGKAVIDRAKVGVTVQGVFETRGSDTASSQLARMKRQKLDVWQDGNPYTLHHKVFIIDDKIVVLGSFNFSDNADSANDENMLIIHNPALAGQFLAEFNRVYAQAQTPPQ